MALITCPECGTEVSDRATTCPKCDNPLRPEPVGPAPAPPPAPAVKKKGRGCLPWIVGGIVLLAVLGFLGSLSGGSSTPSQKTPTSAPAAAQATTPPQAQATAKPAAAPKELPKVGDTAEAGNWAIKVDKVETSDTLGNISKAKSQGRFVVLTITATNKHKETSNLSQNDFQLKGPDGTTYRLSSDGNTAPAMTNTDPKPLLLLEQV